MDNTFNILEDFLRNFAPEVSGRSTGEVDPALKERISEMATGNISSESRTALIQEMLSNPDAVEYLANILKGE